MKILLINKFHYLRGGSEKVYFQTKEILERHGHEARVFSMSDPKNFYDRDEKHFVSGVNFDENKNFLRKAGNIFWNSEAEKNLSDLLDEFHPQIAHIHNFTRQLSPAILSVLKNRGIKIVQTLHDYALICPNYRLFVGGEICERCKVHNYWQAVEHKCVKDSYAKSFLAMLEMTAYWWLPIYRQKVDQFISPSRFLVDKLHAWHFKKEIKILPNPVLIQEENTMILGDYVLFAGRLTEEKGLNLFLSAARNLPQIFFVICGDGPMKNDVLLAQKKYKNLRYLGVLSENELKEKIKSARMVVVPSIWYENYPLAVLEAQALGKTVLASRLGGNEEMIVDNLTGVLFKPNDLVDFLEKISSHYNDLEKLGKIGRLARIQVAQHNSPDVYYENLMAIYHDVLAKK